MAGLGVTLPSSAPGRRLPSAALRAPRLLMSWEDWLTLIFAVITFLSVAVSIQQAEWVRDMPPLVPTAVAALVVGLFAARLRVHALLLLPLVLVVGTAIVIFAVQPYAEGANLGERLADFRFRMAEWWDVVWAGDISNDNLPFVTFVHAITFLFCFLAAWSIYRWHNAWLAIVPAGFVLLTNISFMTGQPSGAFVVYLFGSLLLVSRLHLQRNQARWREEGTRYPDWVSLDTLHLTALLAVILIIAGWVIPLGTQAAAAEAIVERLVRPVEGQGEHLFRLFHNVESKKGTRLHTFGDILPIQGDIELGSKALFEVRASDVGFVRGTSYNEYTGNGWKATDRGRKHVEGSEIAGEGGYLGGVVKTLNVRVIDRESTLLTPGIPLGSNIAIWAEAPDSFPGDVERMDSRRALDEGDAYNTVGWESHATAAELRGAGEDYPGWVRERYLQLPDSLPQRVYEEAARIAEGASTPYDKVIVIEGFLRRLPYDPSVESPPPGRDVVDYFLFDLRRGYFDYQATAMAVLLRTLGVPARVAVGYALDPRDARGSTYTIRKDDAYAWVEVFFPRYGWVAFNPTKNRPAGGAGAGGGSTGDAPEVLTLDELSQILQDPGIPFDPALGALTEPSALDSSGRRVPWLLLATVGALLAATSILALGARVAWTWDLRGLEPSAVFWEKTQRLARLAGFPSDSHETPAEWARRLGARIGQEPETAVLRQAYEETRYGRPDLARSNPEATERAYVKVRNTLVGLILRRGRKTPGERR